MVAKMATGFNAQMVAEVAAMIKELREKRSEATEGVVLAKIGDRCAACGMSCPREFIIELGRDASQKIFADALDGEPNTTFPLGDLDLSGVVVVRIEERIRLEGRDFGFLDDTLIPFVPDEDELTFRCNVDFCRRYRGELDYVTNNFLDRRPTWCFGVHRGFRSSPEESQFTGIGKLEEILGLEGGRLACIGGLEEVLGFEFPESGLGIERGLIDSGKIEVYGVGK